MRTMMEERRQYPHYGIPAPLEVSRGDSGLLLATLVDLSIGGLQLVCNQWTWHQLNMREGQLSSAHKADVRVRLTLIGADETSGVVEADCRSVFSRRVAEDEYRVGLQFLDLSEVSDRVLSDFIARLAGHG